MPIVFEAKMDGSESVRYFHIHMSGLYLGISRRNAEAASLDNDADDALRKTVIAITFAAMALEAFANETAEDVIPQADLGAFAQLRGRFATKGKGSRVLAHLLLLAQEKQFPEPEESLRSAIATIFELRNSLVHYKLSEMAGKVFLPPPRRSPDGSMLSISFIEKPTRIEPPFLQRVTPRAARDAYNAAYDYLRYWMANTNPEGLKDFQRLP